MSYDITQSSADSYPPCNLKCVYGGIYGELQKSRRNGIVEDILTQLSDGSKESAAYLQAIVDGGKNAVDEINSVYSVNAPKRKNTPLKLPR